MYQNTIPLDPIYIFTIVGLVVAFVITFFVGNFVGNQPIEVGRLRRQDGFVIKTFRNLAMDIMMKEFRSLGKPIHTQKGAYRADFLKAVSRKQEELMNICCSTNYLSNDFCSYVNKNYQSVVRKQFYSIIVNYVNYRENAISKNYDKFMSRNDSLTPKEFFDIKSKQTGDVVGVYVIHNKTKDMYYVGQAKRLFFRLNQHFTGHGNGDVYADYKYGDNFTIQIIKLSESGYSDLDKLEKDLINKYNAYGSGYNRTSGNR